MIDVYFLVTFWLNQARFRSNQGVYMYTFTGLSSYFPQTIRYLMIVPQQTAPWLQICMLPIMFNYRLFVLKHKCQPSNRQLMFMLTFPFFIIFSVAVFVILAFCGPNNVDDYGELWYPEAFIPDLVLTDTNRNVYGRLSLIWSRIVLFGAYIISIYFSYQTIRMLQKQKHLSTRTSKLQRELNIMLFFEAFIPLISLVMPYLILLLLNISGLQFKYTSEIVIILVTYSPMLNSLSALLLIQPYRRFITKVIKLKSLTASNTTIISVMPTHFSQSQSTNRK
ncbi:7TM GPCR, serpentine receptor class r (Str) family-containing protein [Aphelenchoides besseyi]|nr:7TM GPCR, serpentine receptor class r (Str) family-containing protein [Aphelenchoides besseyi]